MTGGSAGIEPQRAGIDPFYADARYTSADFFPMFDAPFQYGNGWIGDRGREARARGGDRQGRSTRSCSAAPTASARRSAWTSTISASSACSPHWRPTPKFYDMNNDRYGELEQVFVPFTTSRDLDMDRSGSMDCWDDKKDSDDPEGETGVNAPCTWIQYWVQLDTPAKAAAYHQYLVNYSDQQRASRPLRAPDQRAPAQRDGVAGLQQGRAERRAPAAVAGVRLPAGVPAQHGRPAAGEVPAAQQRDRRAPRARRVAARDLRAVPRRSRRRSAWSAACSASGWRCSACGPCASSPASYANSLAHLDRVDARRDVRARASSPACSRACCPRGAPARWRRRSSSSPSDRVDADRAVVSRMRIPARRSPMELRPILTTLRRHKTASALIVLEIALSCAIICNALFLISGRIDRIERTSGVAENELVRVQLTGIGKDDNDVALTTSDLAALRALPGVKRRDRDQPGAVREFVLEQLGEHDQGPAAADAERHDLHGRRAFPRHVRAQADRRPQLHRRRTGRLGQRSTRPTARCRCRR